MQDQIYNQERKNQPFEFNAEVVSVFPDMISRSVPGYAAMLLMIEQLAARFGKPSTNAYDLGCSLGAATYRIQAGMPADCQIHAVDNSSAMIEEFRRKMADSQTANQSTPTIALHQANIEDFAMSNASLVVLNLTLQFIPLDKRLEVLARACGALAPGGALLLSEKICFEDESQQQLITKMHHDFKRANGYSDLEVAQKRNSLENTLIPETLDDHQNRLEKAGFSEVVLWFQCFNFVSILAVK